MSYPEDPEIVGIDLIDEDNMIIASQFPSRIGLVLNDQAWLQMKQQHEKVLRYTNSGKGEPWLIMVAPLLGRSEAEAWIRVTFSLTNVKKQDAELIFNMTLMTLILIGAGILSLYWSKHNISSILQSLNHVGVLTLELFETRHGLVANETAPRVHNSGHWSIEGAHCSQFENHVRAVAGLPLGCTRAEKPCAMLNIIGEHPDGAGILSVTDAHLHLYGKTERADRKLGHITVLADSYPELSGRMLKLADMLPNPMSLHLSR